MNGKAEIEYVKECKRKQISERLMEWFDDLHGAHMAFIEVVVTRFFKRPPFPISRTSLKKMAKSLYTELNEEEGAERLHTLIEWAEDYPMKKSEFLNLLKLYEKRLELTTHKELKEGRNRLDMMIDRRLLPPTKPFRPEGKGAPAYMFFKSLHGRAARASMLLHHKVGVLVKDIEYTLMPIHELMEIILVGEASNLPDLKAFEIRKIEEWKSVEQNILNGKRRLPLFSWEIPGPWNQGAPKSSSDSEKILRLCREQKTEARNRALQVSNDMAKGLNPFKPIFPGDNLFT